MESLENIDAVCYAEKSGDSEIAPVVWFTFFVSQNRVWLLSAEKFIQKALWEPRIHLGWSCEDEINITFNFGKRARFSFRLRSIVSDEENSIFYICV